MTQIIKETVEIYNEKRPHYSNHMLTPNQMHNQNKLNIKTYKTKNTCKTFLQVCNYLFLSNKSVFMAMY